MSISRRRANNIKSIKDKDIDYSDILELDESLFTKAKLELPEKKKAISIRIDSNILQWFKSKGLGYQTLINAVLKAYVRAQKN